jgi:hypothetical protein
VLVPPGWALPELVEWGEGDRDKEEKDWALHVEGLVPYWMGKGEGVSNDVDLQGVFLLTAPNMSGQSSAPPHTCRRG